VAVERATTPASKSKILAAMSRRERKRIRVILSRNGAKGALRNSNIYNAIEFAFRQQRSVMD
jgi:hypothetical protein